MNVLATAGRSKIYNTDGTGRDTYVSTSSGGFTMQNMPAPAWRGGTFGVINREVSPQHVARGGGQGSPGKTINYQVNGTGRDSYIHSTQGGFASNYTWQSDQDAYVNSLRGYPTTVQSEQRAVYTKSKRSPERDHFVEGQCSLRSPKARNDLRMLKTSQRMQTNRLSMPKRINTTMDEMTVRQSITQNTMRRSINVSGNQARLMEQGPEGVSIQSPRFLKKTIMGPFTTAPTSAMVRSRNIVRGGFLSQSMQTGQIAHLTHSFDKSSGMPAMTRNSLRNMLSQNRATETVGRQRYQPAAINEDMIRKSNQLDMTIDQTAAVGQRMPQKATIKAAVEDLDAVRIMDGHAHAIGKSSFLKHNKK